MTELCTDIIFPLAKNGNGNQVKRELLDSKEEWVIATLKKHHKTNNKNRPYCLCKSSHPKMQISKIQNNLYLKRLPNTGWDHHPDCPSYGETVSSKKIDYKNAITIEDGLINISASTTLNLHTQTRITKGEQGGSQRTGTARHRLSLKDSFHFIWSEAGLGSQKENEIIHHDFIKDKINSLSSRLSYNSTLLIDVLIIPNALQPDQQRDLIKTKAEENNSEKKLILIGMLNRLLHETPEEEDKSSFSKYHLNLYNGQKSKSRKTISYFLDSNQFAKAQRTLNFKNKEWNFEPTEEGKVWVIAIIENKQNAAGITYGKVSEIEFIPVTNEHVPC